MPSTLANPAATAPRELPETAHRMARAEVRKAESDDFKAEIGGAIERARMVVGWSLKELAGQVHRDPRQVARWESGEERPQFDAAVEALQQPLVIELAKLAKCEIQTTVHIRRNA